MAEDFRSRLRRLRREPQAGDAPGDDAAALGRQDEGHAPEARAAADASEEPACAESAAAGTMPAAADGVSSGLDNGPEVQRPAASAFERLKKRGAGREAAATPAADEAPSARAPASIRLVKEGAAPPHAVPAATAFVPPRPRSELSFDPPARIEASGATRARRTLLPSGHAHGDLRLGAWSAAQARTLAELARDPRIADCDLSRALFLDTETSGLSGGAGTYVWMVGLGRFVAGAEDESAQFEVWQGFLDHPSREAELLRETAARIAAASMVVTFFGKSFDRHRLEDKMRLHRIAPPFEAIPHLDLYWPLRRAHRGKWGDCRLKTLEHHLCGVRRHDDLPGSFAPAAWFDFLAGRPHRLEGVFRHNHDDILSLVVLAAQAGCGIPDTPAPGAY